VEQAARLDPTAMRLAFILVLLGYGTKAGLAPMHTWKPDAYSEAPVPSAAILSTAMLNCALYGLMRFYVLTSRCLGPEFPGRLLLLLGLLSLGIAVPFILLQRNFRRLLAYSSIDQAGIMAIALGLGGPLGALALMLHMTYHTVAKSLLFLCAGNVYQHCRTDLFAKVKGGILRAMPITGAVFLLAMLAVAGMPPFSLFQSEFLIVKAALAGGHYLTTALFVLFGAGIFAGLLVRIGGLVLGVDGETPAAPIDPWRHLPIVTLAAVLVVLAFYLPAPLLALIRGAAQVIGAPQ
jgi:hydrogenase-4 component F